MNKKNTLVSQSREIAGIQIRHDIQSGQLNLSDLDKADQKCRKAYGWAKRGKIQDIISQKENSERIYYLLKETGKINSEKSEFMEKVSAVGMIKFLKELKVYKTTGARQNKTVWCDPYIFVLIAMELNPMLYSKAVVWLSDKLIFNRIEAASMFKDLTNAVSRFPDTHYGNLSKALNYVVFGRHVNGIRNTGTEEQLNELQRIEANMAFSIDAGFIKSFPELMEHIRGLWRKKYSPKIA